MKKKVLIWLNALIPAALLTLGLSILCGCKTLEVIFTPPRATPTETPRALPTTTPTVVPTATVTPEPTVTPTSAPVAPPVLKEWKNGLHGGKLILSVVVFNDRSTGKAILYDSTRHYDHAWPDVCDGHEPAWSTWCGFRDWDAHQPAIWDAGLKVGGFPVRMGEVGGQPYAKYIEYRPGEVVVVRTCPHLPDITNDGIILKVKGLGCGQSEFRMPKGLKIS